MSGGGTEAVLDSGTASFTVVSCGGTERVFAGGTTTGVSLANGGTQEVYLGGVLSDGGGTAIGTSVNSGGFQVVALRWDGQFYRRYGNGGTAVVVAGGTAFGLVVRAIRN